MNRFYLHASNQKGYLKHIPTNEFTVHMRACFSKNKTLAKVCESEAQAKDYQSELIAYCTSGIDNLKGIIDRTQEVLEHWDDYKNALDRAAYIKCPPNYTHYFDKKQAMSDRRWDHGACKAQSEFRTSYYKHLQLKKIISKITIQEEEAEILFYANRKAKIKWVESPKEIRTSGDRIYCNCCGGVIPDIKYLKIDPSTYQSTDLYLCAFCVSRLASEVKNVVAGISEEVKSQYENDRFLKLL